MKGQDIWHHFKHQGQEILPLRHQEENFESKTKY